MATNIEIKARARDWDRLLRVAGAISDTPARVIHQRDVFFETLRGRLKLRVLAPDFAQLVYYERANASGPRASVYHLSDTSDPAGLEALLAAALSVRGEVIKARTLYMVGNTRIHLDQVAGLGEFIELEAVLGPEQTEHQGRVVVDELMQTFEIREADLIDVAYIDLLDRAAAHRR